MQSACGQPVSPKELKCCCAEYGCKYITSKFKDQGFEYLLQEHVEQKHKCHPKMLRQFWHRLYMSFKVSPQSCPAKALCRVRVHSEQNPVDRERADVQ